MTISIPMLNAQKNVLLVGDEGVTIYAVSSAGARYIDQLAWLAADFEEKLSDTLRRDCPQKPVVILYDMVEQHYRKEMVPSVGFFDKANVIKRKVAVTFPNYKMRAALELKASKSVDKDAKGLKTNPYLFSAVPSSELMSSLVRAIIKSSLPVEGLYLLPVEGTGLVSKILKSVPKENKAAKWTLFMGQHASGNLRQIVIKNGELALTRMTPFSEDQASGDAWAQGIAQEYKVTISYLSRLGYVPDDGINIVIVGSEDVADSTIRKFTDLKNANFSFFSLQDVENALKIKLGEGHEAGFADVLFVNWVGRASKYILPIPVAQFEQAKQPRMIANLGLVAGIGLLGWFGYQSFMTGTQYLSVSSQLQEREAQLLGEKDKYARLLDEKQKEGYDIRLYKGAFTAQSELEDYTLKPFKILKGVSLSLGPVLSIDNIQIRHSDGTNVKFDNLDAISSASAAQAFGFNDQTQQEGYQLYSRMSMTFAASVSQEEANRILNQLVQQMQGQLPGYEISIQKAVRDRSYEVDVEGRIGAQAQQPDLEEDNTAIIEIRGVV